MTFLFTLSLYRFRTVFVNLVIVLLQNKTRNHLMGHTDLDKLAIKYVLKMKL